MAVNMSIDLKKLKHIVEVDRSQGITMAAQNLLITQSALTRSIADAETELGVQLFQRLPRGVRATDAGRKFIQRARRILGEMDELLEETSEFRELKSGNLKVGFSPGAFQSFFASSLVSFAAEYPGIRMAFFSGSAENQTPKLLSGDIDVIVGSQRQLRRWPELNVNLIRDLYSTIIVRKEHPVLQMESICLTDLIQYPWIQSSSVEPIDSDLLRILNKESDRLIRPHYMCDDFDLVKDIVNNTNAISPVFSPTSNFAHLERNFALLGNIIELPTHSLAIATNKSRPPSYPTEKLIDHIKAELGTLRPS